MRSILGIDAAWTEREPSGVALIADYGSGWRLVKAEASYEAFMRPAPITDPSARYRGSIPDVSALLETARNCTGAYVDIVAIDMPLSMAPIVSRRAPDNMISAAYGARHASTHTPSVTRPGKLSNDLRLGFQTSGYPLAVSGPKGRALVEVYPHPALIELATAERRLPYKISKIRKYWPDVDAGARRENLLEMWRKILALLDSKVQGVEAALRMPTVAARGVEMKAFEDMLDSVVCAWVGACVLDGQARAYGDENSAIWVPDLPETQRMPS